MLKLFRRNRTQSGLDLGTWTDAQLRRKLPGLYGELDGLVDYRRATEARVHKVVENISAIESLRRSVDVGDERDTLDHLRAREMELRQLVSRLGRQIAERQVFAEAIEHELAGRGGGSG